MTKKEVIWREILHQAIENKKIEFTQKELAKKFGFTLSTVFNAIKIPRQSGAIKVTGKNFIIQDAEKFLYIWATQRNINKEIIYQTNVLASSKKIEGMMPANIVFACFSAYAHKYKSAPAEYDKVYVYAAQEGAAEIQKRFPSAKGYTNLIVLKSDSWLKNFGGLITPDSQTFVDLWNLHEWYAKDFLSALKQKMFG